MKNLFLNNQNSFINKIKDKIVCHLALSVIFMCLIMIILDWLFDHNIRVRNINVFYGAVVAASALAGGIKAGLINVFIGTFFSYLYFARIHAPLVGIKILFFKPYMQRSILNMLVSFISLLAICIVVSTIKNKLSEEKEELKKARDDLYESKELLKAVLNSTGEGVLAIDNNGQITLSNTKFKNMFNIPKEILNTKDFYKALDYVKNQFVDSDLYVNKIIGIRKTEVETSFELIFKDRRIYEVYTCPLVKNGNIKGRVTSYRDVTQQRKIENGNKEHAKLLQTLINTIPNPIYYKDTDLKYMGCNDAFASLVAMPISEITGKSSYELFNINKADEFMSKDNEILKNNQVQVHKSELIAIDGTTHSIIINKANFTNSEGEIEGIVGIITDITNIQKLQKELTQSHARYKNLVELLPEAIIVHNQGIIKYVNKAFLNFTGSNESESTYFLGRHVLEFIEEGSKALVSNRIDMLKNHSSKNIKVQLPWVEEKCIKMDGSLLDLEVTVVPFPDEDMNSVMIVAKDITEKKKSEALEKSLHEEKKLLQEAVAYNKIKTDFFANISHELRTPLNVILGAIQLINYNMKEDFILGNGNCLKKYIYPMKQNCFRLLRIVNNLIDITKIDAGYFDLNLNNYNIVGIVEDITMSVVNYVEERGISIVFDTDVEEKILACDVDKIERIMLNLLSNAIKFTHKGDLIEVKMIDLGEKISISVIDSGIGIPADKVNMIFERFIQVDKSLARNHEGSGIGLSLVKSLVEMHDGVISVNSELGKGSNFTLEIPVRLVEDSNQVKIPVNNIEQEVVERINIEFSDIYSA
jgi:PAS domain S-box-containing protein